MLTDEQLQVRIHGGAALPSLVYLPGIHGDWTLVGSFRAALAGRVRFVEFIYPRTLTWGLAEYAAAVEAALLTRGVSHGWVVGESFGSQVAWGLCWDSLIDIESGRRPARVAVPPCRSSSVLCKEEGPPASAPSGLRFQTDGLVLAGGFVRYPAMWGVGLARRLGRSVSLTWLTRFLGFYAKCARIRHCRAPETLASIDEFIARRNELDRQAIVHRLRLIQDNDPRPIARRTRVPVYVLSGCLDPIVPWWLVRAWLRRHCPGYRGGKAILLADHNVLGTSPRRAARQVLQWIECTHGADTSWKTAGSGLRRKHLS
jgi:pimeloyl-ACP methyl ester carboxylesterase